MAVFGAFYALGVFLSSKFDITFLIIFLLAYFLICLCARPIRYDRLALVLAFCMGALLSQGFSNTEFRKLNGYAEKYAVLTGRVCEAPEHGALSTTYVVDVRQIVCDNASEKVKEHMLVYCSDIYRFGDTVEFRGFVSELPDRMNKSGFDLKLYYKSKGIFFRCFADSSSISEEKIRDYSIYYLSAASKNSISNLIDKYSNGDRAEILKAVLTGNHSGFSDDFDRLLRHTGTKRFFYPAFLHVFILLSLINLFSGIINKKKRDIITVALLVLYAVWESAHPVMIKACLLTAVIILFKRRLGYLYFKNAIGAVVLIAGILNPLLLFNACFVMSIGASLIISFFYEFADGKLVGIKNRYMRRTLALGVLCTVGLLPLSAYYFHGLTIYTIVTALIFLPLTLCILIISPGLLLMLYVLHSAPFIGQAVTLLLWVYEKLPNFIGALPFSYIALPSPSLTQIIAFYIALYALWHYTHIRTFNSAAAAAAAFGFILVSAASSLSGLNVMEIDFVNVGQGDGAVIRLPYKNTILLDGGGGTAYNEEYNPGKSIYLPYLESAGISRIDCAIVSHFHKDHVQGIIAAIENLNVEHVYIPEALSDNELGTQLQLAAKENGTAVHKISEDTTLIFNSGIVINIFVPVGTALLSDDENDTSLMVRISYGDTDCIFTGDMTKLSENNMIKYNRVEPSEILKAAHHGSKTSNSEEFIRAVSPITAIISVGEDNIYGHPADETLKTLYDLGISVYRTDLNGDIRIFADKKRIRAIKTYKE